MTDLFGDAAAPAQALARKWRPRVFADLKGQEHVVQALSNALTQGRLHHAYLLTGTRGVGKTTLARILAKCFNCETGVTATPCGVCSACTQIDAGRFVDLLELDAASNTGVDNMREVLDNAQYAPTVGRFKVYLIDEVHMLSKSAFNSMLKTLEEPPAHVKFILATTDPQKIPVTVLSRCLQFNLKPMPPTLVAAHLGAVLAAEAVDFEAAALNLLARAAAGSMRDALSLTDQAIAYGGGRLRADEIDTMLGTVRRDYLFDLLEALARVDGDALLSQAQALAERGVALDGALQDLAQLLTQLAVALHAPGALADEPEHDQLIATAQRFDAETLQLFYQIALNGRRDLPFAPDDYAGFCMTLLRMLAFTPEAGAGSDRAVARTRGSGVPAAAAGVARTASARPGPVARQDAPDPDLPDGGVRVESARPAAVVPAPTVPAGQPAPVQAAEERGSYAATATAGPQPVLNARAEETALPHSASAFPPTPAPDAAFDWLAETARLKGMAKMLADHCEVVHYDGQTLQLQLDPEHRHLLDRTYQERLAASLRARLGAALRIDIQTGAAVRATPQRQRTQAREERHADAVAALQSDAFVQSLIADFGGRIDPASIQPLGDSP